MTAIFEILRVIGLIFVVIMMFNIAIFVHELGHFLAARWRKVYVDRFQVWFGKPLWKKKIGDVQYGLGWIPAGGFVSLPQMVTMESVEGDVEGMPKNLPPITPMDKIIVAVAGPLFSLLLAVVFGFLLWGIGKPVDQIETTQIGYVLKESPAEKAGLLPGDIIRTIDGNEVTVFQGDMRKGIVENIVLGEKPTIDIVVEREGETLTKTTDFEIPDTKWYERTAMRRIGVGYAEPAVISQVIEQSPAADAGLKEGDRILEMGGTEILSTRTVADIVEGGQGAPIELIIERGGEKIPATLTPEIPKTPEGAGYKIGVGWSFDGVLNETIQHPTPWQTISDSVDTMYLTISKVLAPGSSIKPQHLNGPVGIAKANYDLLNTENGWRRVLWFAVFLNINLAILNMLPLPILDGGHIVMAILEKIKGSPVNPKILGAIQGGFALILLSFMLYITSKDVVDTFRPTGGGEAPEEMTFE